MTRTCRTPNGRYLAKLFAAQRGRTALPPTPSLIVRCAVTGQVAGYNLLLQTLVVLACGMDVETGEPVEGGAGWPFAQVNVSKNSNSFVFFGPTHSWFWISYCGFERTRSTRCHGRGSPLPYSRLEYQQEGALI